MPLTRSSRQEETTWAVECHEMDSTWLVGSIPVSDQRPTVSVVIPVLNGARWLACQLEALSRDDAQPFETIIADNGSTDDTIAIARSFDREMRLRVIDASERRGQSFARNLGARAATGDLLLFLDHDDEIGPGYVAAMVSALRGTEFVAARIDDHKLNAGWCRKARTVPLIDELRRSPIPWAPGGTLGVRRTTFERLGGFAEDLFCGEDVEFCRRAQKHGVVLKFVPEAILHYRYRTTLRGFVRQGNAYGFADVVVDARCGTFQFTSWSIIRSCAGPIRLLVMGPTKGNRARGLFLLGRRLGRMQALRQLTHELPRLPTDRPTQLSPIMSSASASSLGVRSGRALGEQDDGGSVVQ